MPTVEFSASATANIIQSVNPFDSNSGMFGTSNLNSPSESRLRSNPSARIGIFSGTIPAQPRLMTASSFTNTLIFWNMISELSTFSQSAGLITISTISKAPIATGTASWFALCWYDATPPATSGTLQQRIIGTVGTIGSGEDLEIPTTSIVLNNSYRLFNLRIQIPSSYTY